jgi:hypothetical protein
MKTKHINLSLDIFKMGGTAEKEGTIVEESEWTKGYKNTVQYLEKHSNSIRYVAMLAYNPFKAIDRFIFSSSDKQKTPKVERNLSKYIGLAEEEAYT